LVDELFFGIETGERHVHDVAHRLKAQITPKEHARIDAASEIVIRTLAGRCAEPEARAIASCTVESVRSPGIAQPIQPLRTILAG
jgi:hypothetical protein